MFNQDDFGYASDSRQDINEKPVMETSEGKKKVEKRVTISPQVDIKSIPQRPKEIELPKRCKEALKPEVATTPKNQLKDLSVIVEDSGIKNSSKLHRKSLPDYEKLMKQMKKLSEYNSQHDGIKQKNRSDSNTNSLEVRNYRS